ncbi:hypothetical protein E2562_027190 [Oryza meyeriana var. granulata]|uniref:Uncharacterized protein n=1 Tax=Oryza meyeriana var. granulata TaxID=110450 RepID=A0A6G1EZD6_9ORYZ|nr:hypothetical protein E2562_027190 [Oryza meyeriana var. granulata]
MSNGREGSCDEDSTCLARCQARRRKSRLADSSGRPLSAGSSPRSSGRSSLARSVARRSAPTATSRRASVPETTTPTAKSPGLGSYRPPASSWPGGTLRLRTKPADNASSRGRAGLARATCLLCPWTPLATGSTRRGFDMGGEPGKRRRRGAAAAAIAGGILPVVSGEAVAASEAVTLSD